LPNSFRTFGLFNKNLKKTKIMLKNILKLEGAQELTKNEQKSIKGSNAPLCNDGLCAIRVKENGRWSWRCLPC
jgi:hypothetical protein